MRLCPVLLFSSSSLESGDGRGKGGNFTSGGFFGDVSFEVLTLGLGKD